MDMDFIRELIAVVSRSPVGELEVERDGVRIRIVKQAASPSSSVLPAEVRPGPGGSPEKPDPDGPEAVRHLIRAPLTGVFYRSSAEGEPPLVSVGDTVEEGQKIGLLEAMKTFNVVEADRAGRVVEIVFGDHAAVGSGDILFVLDETG